MSDTGNGASKVDLPRKSSVRLGNEALTRGRVASVGVQDVEAVLGRTVSLLSVASSCPTGHLRVRLSHGTPAVKPATASP